MNIGSIKPNDQGILIGRVQTMAFVATIALQEVNSTNERAPAFDVLALAADRRSSGHSLRHSPRHNLCPATRSFRLTRRPSHSALRHSVARVHPRRATPAILPMVRRRSTAHRAARQKSLTRSCRAPLRRWLRG